jgi:Cys-tRNA synthase (O-phospho-L-seryl-tRNA:Cys-tRNA synthase)
MREQFLETIHAPAVRQFTEDVGEVLKRRHAVLCAGARQAIQIGRTPRRLMRPCEEEILAAEGDVA